MCLGAKKVLLFFLCFFVLFFLPVFYFFSLLDFLAALPGPAFFAGRMACEAGRKVEERKKEKRRRSGRRKGERRGRKRKRRKRKKRIPHAAQRHGGLGLICDFGIGVCNVTWEISGGECFTRGVAPGAGEIIICAYKFEADADGEGGEGIAARNTLHLCGIK